MFAGPAVTPVPSLSTKIPKEAVSKAKDVGRVDIATVQTSILHDAVAAAIAGVDSVALDEEKKRAVTDSIDAAIRLRLVPDLESILVRLGLSCCNPFLCHRSVQSLVCLNVFDKGQNEIKWLPLLGCGR